MIETIKRSQIKKADYNPRVISAENLANLEQSMQKFGLVGLAFVWNKRTGHLISGHQRLGLLDKQHGYPGLVPDYEVQADVQDMTLEDEIELNMKLNSTELTGRFKEGAVKALIEKIRGKDAGKDLEATILGLREKSASKLKKLTLQRTPDWNWLVVAVPIVRYGEAAGFVEALKGIPDAQVFSVLGDGRKD